MKPRRYAKLINELMQLRQDMVTRGLVQYPVTFQQVEEWAQTSLPRSAYEHRAWWSNNDGNYSNALKPWDQAFLSTAEVDMEAQSLVFQLWDKDAERARKNQPSFDWAAFRIKLNRARAQTTVVSPPQPGLEDVARPYQTQADGRHPVRGSLKGKLRIVAGTDLTKPADPDWADRS